MQREIKSNWGILKENNDRYYQNNDAIVFQGPTNAQRTDTAVKFPSEDGEIDLSASFTPKNPASFTEKPSSTSMLHQIFGAFANCFIYSQNGTATSGSANTGFLQYPNGTQVFFSKCEVVQILT